jgi:hypothetical protein
MDPPSNMDEQTKKFLYDEETDEAARRLSDKNINASHRQTNITDNQGSQIFASNGDKSPVFKYTGNNKGDLSPFGQMRRTFS